MPSGDCPVTRELPASYADLVGREGGVVTSRASPGCRIPARSPGWRIPARSPGWRIPARSPGWRIPARSTGWRIPARSGVRSRYEEVFGHILRHLPAGQVMKSGEIQV